jgi:hypothetical protein
MTEQRRSEEEFWKHRESRKDTSRREPRTILKEESPKRFVGKQEKKAKE